MTRSQRRRHIYLWAFIGPASLLLLVAAILARRPIPVQQVSTAAHAREGAGSP